MAYHDIDFMPWRAENRELAELANRQLATMPLLRERLAGIPVCSPQCRVRHPVVTAGGHQFRHITIGYAVTDDLANTQLWPDKSGSGSRLIYIVVNTAARATPTGELQTLATHELVHCGEFIQNCGHPQEHCLLPPSCARTK
ncbi:hypothetical protein AAVH_34513 [Aphelenchoides avenae]|nr:hypothetical protein AAVH_34513 [Aphelenchus avenae]